MVHDKILNFLTPIDNLAVLEGREAIVANLFGVNSNKARKTGDSKKPTKKSKKADEVEDAV